MTLYKFSFAAAALCLVLTGVTLRAQSDAKTGDDMIPADTIARLQSEPARPSAEMTDEQKHEYIVKFMEQRLAEADAVIAKYPTAKNVMQAKIIKLTAAFMLSQENSLSYEKYSPQIMATADEIVADKNADQDSKMLAMMYKYRTKIHFLENKDDIRASLDEMLSIIKKDYNPAMGYMLAIQMAMEKKNRELAKAYLTQARIEFPDNESFVQMQQRLDRPVFVGKPFAATLTLLDGKTLKMPDDLKGKVVVVDFWASWCGPCRQFGKYLKKFYDKYKDKGVVVLGINIDSEKSALEAYLKEHPDYTWMQAFSGQGAQDPTALKYGVNSIPSVWVIGKDGNIVSDDARGDLEGIVEKALK